MSGAGPGPAATAWPLERLTRDAGDPAEAVAKLREFLAARRAPA